MATQEELAGLSIEQIEALAIKEAGGAVGAGDATGSTGPVDDEMGGDDEMGTTAIEGEQDVGQASSGQPESNTEKKASDKEHNFAALRAKNKQLAEDLAKSQEQINALAKRPVFTAELPVDHAQKMAEADEAISKVWQSFQEGDIGPEEYQSQTRAANAVREQLLSEAMMANISKKMVEQQAREQAETATQSWERTVGSFIGSKPDGVDYQGDEVKNRDLNTYVKALAADADNSDKPMDWFLTEAHALVRAKHRIASAAPKIDEPNHNSSESNPARMPFQTLSDVPGGLLPSKGEVEQLDEVSGSALQNRFLNDPGAVDKFLASLG